MPKLKNDDGKKKLASQTKSEIKKGLSGEIGDFPVGTPLNQVYIVPAGDSRFAKLTAAGKASDAMNRMRFGNLYGNIIENPGQTQVGSFDFNDPAIQSRMKERGLDRDYINSYQPQNYQQKLTSEQTREKFFVGPPEAPNFEDGGYIYGSGLLPQYGFGSWLKENGAGLLKGASSLVSLIPGIGQIAGPLLNVAGSAIGAVQQNNADQELADQQQAGLDEQAAVQEELQRTSDLNTQNQNVRNRASNFATYGSSVVLENGGQIGDGITGQPQIVEYEDGNTHQEGIGGIPVDTKGNPSIMSNQSAVGLTEKGEVTWNSYVFSDKLEYDG